MVRFNAIKSGLTAESVVITVGRGKEDVAAFEDLKTCIWEHYKPVGFQEEFYVGEIIRLTWRLRRADRYENGSIRLRMKRVDSNAWREASRLPHREPLLLTLRYQTTIARRLDKLFVDLERLQRRRAKVERRTASASPSGSSSASIVEPAPGHSADTPIGALTRFLSADRPRDPRGPRDLRTALREQAGRESESRGQTRDGGDQASQIEPR